MRRRDPHGRSGVAAGCAVITVSDTRGAADDRSGDVLCAALERGGHRVVARAWVRDEPAA
ncbi:MAG: molybdenum cofactor biosynthesis protein B, partial [Candidatus Eisenbacteria bacterium]|nr:molybdenum cofactor biosynthesis protein B [Candidatus Eisenbacteria bacterium]